MKSLKRVYRGATIDFLIAAKTILNAAYSHQANLVTVSTLMTLLYLDGLKVRLNAAFDIIGGDKGAPQRAATRIVKEIAQQANTILADMKVVILAYYDQDKVKLKETLLTLGFTANLAKAKKGDQEALISLLLSFRSNLSASLEAEFLAAGVPAASILSIKNFADTLLQADVDQETLKGTSKEFTRTEVETLNAAYKEIITIAKVGQRAFLKNSEVKTQFVYSNVLKRINVQNPPASTPPASTPPVTE